MQTFCPSVSVLEPYLDPRVHVYLNEVNLPACDIPRYSTFMEANSYFFGHPVWGREYFEESHRSDIYRDRWLAATGSWDNKVVVDVGCGPGNVYATIGGSPKIVIGVDISPGALQMAAEVGYVPLLADAQNLPLRDGFADIVIANATLHHCDDMAKVLSEAARLVKPGGVLVTDQDTQLSAWNLKGLGLFLRDIRFVFYRLIGSQYFIPEEVRNARFATETHNQRPGDGITVDLYHEVLEPMGFEFKVFPHNHDLGAEVLQGQFGRMPWKNRLGQRLSGINPDTPEAAQSIMCVAHRPSNP